LIGLGFVIKTCCDFPRLFCCGRHEREEVYEVSVEEEIYQEEEEDYYGHDEYCEEDHDQFSRSIG